MKKFLLLLTGLGLLLSSCKKDQSLSTDLNVNGYGPMMFVSGDAISIYGSGFDPDPDNNTVLFEGVAGEVASATPNRLQVIVPLLANSGKITVLVHGKTVVSNLQYTLLNLLGSSSSNTILSADKKYLLRGNVSINAKLIIQAGTTIFCEKATHASLYVYDIDFEGTPAQPIVFTSDQPAGSREPGDWAGITVGSFYNSAGNNYIANGVMKYVRVEFAGYSGTALSLNMDPGNLYQNIQVSNSLHDGFNFNTGVSNGDALVNYLVAFACQGADFRFNGANINVQYALGLKDPYAANGSGQGVLLDQASTVRLSNFTLIGYNPATRNVLSGTPGFPLNSNAGRGVQIGNSYFKYNTQLTDYSEQFDMYNSVIVGGWLAGISMYGQGNGSGSPWADYENSGTGDIVSLRNDYIVSTASAVLPFRGGAYAKENVIQNTDGFESTQGDPKRTLFASYNDTTKVLDFNSKKDDLGIGGIADYNNLNHPVVLPASNSILQTSASFPSGSALDNPIFNKDVKFVGAFGTQDWTTPWCNFNPQLTNY